MAKKLRALDRYTNGPRGLSYLPGQEFEASNDLFLFLMADAPGVFVPVVAGAAEGVAAGSKVEAEVESKALEQPPADKMVKTPKAKK